ncbi:MAG TPA: asparagine synthase (glutamine-hydrolyzing) [Verrucomicrobiota bacterium]|nr:asparagine synthase (glutamine-hydrolyzing) [Verrucomicrobiota bacterium]
MCAIAGIITGPDADPVDELALRRMCSAMAHRGPDGSGFYIDQASGVGLGHRRLSIIDLEGGSQPMATPDGTLVITFNGEIYNHRELRRELEGAGYEFRTSSDTEVLLLGYRHWGDAVLYRINGMFAFGLWDQRNDRVVLARDSAGIKPLYYRILGPRQLVFASEANAIEAFDRRKPDIELAALYSYMRLGYTPSPLSINAGTGKLAPGTMLTVSSGGIRQSRWWASRPRPFNPPPSFADAAKRLLELYSAAVRRNLVSDVPVGLLLSGGLDSGLLLALINECGSRVKCFTATYGTDDLDDELVDANGFARALGNPHAAARISRKLFEDQLSHVVASLDEPIGSASIVPMFFVSQRARADVKVALMGQGPDELLGGYRRHVGVYYGQYWRCVPSPIRHAARHALDLIPGLTTFRRAAYSLDVPNRLARYLNVVTLLSPDLLADLFRPGLIANELSGKILESWAELVPGFESLDELNGFNYLEVRSTLPDQLLAYGDRLSMAHGLEVRFPFLDVEVINYVEQLPSAYKICGLRRKLLQRKICRRFLPARAFRGRKKGFAANITARWFRGPQTCRMGSLLRDPGSLIFAYFEPSKVGALLDLHQTGKRDHSRVLFNLVVLEEWLRLRSARS